MVERGHPAADRPGAAQPVAAGVQCDELVAVAQEERAAGVAAAGAAVLIAGHVLQEQEQIRQAGAAAALAAGSVVLLGLAPLERDVGLRRPSAG